MTEGRRRRRPGPAAVLWGSLGLFALLFALLAHQLATGPGAATAGAESPAKLRKVVIRRVVTTVVHAPAAKAAAAAPEAEPESSALVSSPEVEAAAVEPEPVVTSSS